MSSPSATHAGVDEFTDITEAQIVYSHHYRVDGTEPSFTSAAYRYVWPSELDLMARIAGMSLRHRWATWTKEPFTGESTSHVSVWVRP